VFGLQHQAHPALAWLVQDHVVAQHQRPALAGVNLLGLVSRELLETDQLLRQLFAILRFLLGGQVVDQCRHVVGRRQAAVDNLADELVQRNRHDEFSDGSDSVSAAWFLPK